MRPGKGATASPAEDTPDRRLVRRFVQTRDEAAFRDLHRAHGGYLFGLALRLVGGRREDAEDAVQEAWLRATSALPAFRWDSALRTWLGGFVVNCCRELRRRAGRDEGCGPPAAVDPPEAAALDLESAVRGLPDGLREVLVLHVIEGYTHEEISGLLGIAEGTSKSRLFDARVALRRSLRAEEKGVGP